MTTNNDILAQQRHNFVAEPPAPMEAKFNAFCNDLFLGLAFAVTPVLIKYSWDALSNFYYTNVLVDNKSDEPSTQDFGVIY